MDTTFIDIVKKLVAEQGKETLLNQSKCRSFLTDYAKGDYKKESRLLLQALESGCQKAIMNTPDFESTRPKIVQKLVEDEFIAEHAAVEIVDLLAFVLGVSKNIPKRQSIPVTVTATTPVPPIPIAVIDTSTRDTKAKTIPDGFVKIQGGTFMMGSPVSEVGRSDNEAQHRVTVGSFWMGQYEVTQAEYETIIGSNPSKFKGGSLPVENVSWFDAVFYCNQRSAREGLTPAYTINGENVAWNRSANGYRLPTEAEWEYACRANTTTPFSTGYNISTSQTNYNGNYPYVNNPKETYRGKTINVGSFASNSWGLYDMHGNVFEWCWDWYEIYSTADQTDPTGAASGSNRVLRGGSWFSYAQYLRSAYRVNSAPSSRGDGGGFRVVRP